MGYDTNSPQKIVYNAHVAKGSYLGIGYGPNMSNTDMVAWEAGTNATTSTVQDLYSTEEGRPSLDTVNAYNTSSTTENGEFIDFVTTRFANPGTEGKESYIINLGQEVSACWAYGVYTDLSGDTGLDYHSNNRNTWEFTVNSDGSATSGGNNGLGPLPVPDDVTLVLNITATGNTLYTGYNSTSGEIKYYAHVKENTYLGMGYGKSMVNVPMVSWMAGSSPSNS